MKLQQEHHAEQLEELLSSRADQNVSARLHSAVPDSVDTELSEIVALARYLQATPSLMADPVFAKSLERKVLAHNVRHIQAKATKRNGHWLFGWAPQVWVAFATVLLCMFIGTGTTLAMATGAENPDNPLYGIKVLEQHIQLSLASSPQNQAEVNLQIIRDRLKTAASMANASHADAYQKALQDADQRITAVSQVINSLPTGADRQRLASELTTVKTDARQTLYSLLPRLPLTAQLATTTMLSHLGAAVPSIQSATIVVTSHPAEQATITITGTHLTSSTRLVINNRLVAGDCTLQDNTCVFVIPWHAHNPPGTIAVLNEDDTIAQTTAIAFTDPDGNNITNGNGSNNKNGGNGSNSGDGTNPTDKGSNGSGDNGHGHSNPGDGAKPTSTPVPHH
jgi:hypothetical protein